MDLKQLLFAVPYTANAVNFSQPRDKADRTHLESFVKSCVPLQGHSHGGVDTCCEGDVDEGHQDGDGPEQGQVLQDK